ncbi:MAG: glycosyltransferase family 8 protein, partial [Fusobacteriaceae bacterium]
MERNLVFLINEKGDYARHLGTVLISTLENSQVFWNVYVIYTTLSQESQQKLKALEKKYQVKLNFIQLEDSLMDGFKLGEGTHLDKIVFGRLYIPNILLNEKKALYMDIDMIVKQPLEELYNLELGEFSIGAVPDGNWDQEQSKERLGLENGCVYFNAGIMLMDLEKLRENRIFDRVIEYCLNPDRELKLNEQDALNIIFENNYKQLPIKWNYTHCHSEEQSLQLKEIGVIHYTGSIKPWDCRSLSPFRKEYWKYLEKTPWKGWKEENWSLPNVLKRELTFFKI